MSTSEAVFDQRFQMHSTTSEFQQHLDHAYPSSAMTAYGRYMRAMRARYAEVDRSKMLKAMGTLSALFKWTDDDWFFEHYREHGGMQSEDLSEQDAPYLDGDSELLEGTTMFVEAITRWNHDEGLEECARSVCRNRRNRDAYLQELREWLKAKEEKALWQRLKRKAGEGEQLKAMWRKMYPPRATTGPLRMKAMASHSTRWRPRLIQWVESSAGSVDHQTLMNRRSGPRSCHTVLRSDKAAQDAIQR
ncbi:hypothetical protein QFC20_006717 [Naganishia adeliensis]|uniref:Uncharacterized protein n=1 Tax=Naganishia adeliensis TaxID=92952 RepID=A0ACC2V7Z2_9TREE|nr:hypothetical protein QFC20_006717 [Naganishia adeliensis]